MPKAAAPPASPAAGLQRLDLDVAVDYYRDCAETKPYLTKTFTNQIAVSGDRFGDAGDSGALIVDTANAEPVGLFFAGGIDASGVSHGIANPAPDVLNALGTQMPGDTSFSFVGTADHEVSCLSYGDSTTSSAQARMLSDAESSRQQAALAAGRALVNPSAGILGIAPGKSSDQPGTAALIVYVDESLAPVVPIVVEGVRTIVIPATARSVALGSAPFTATAAALPPLAASAIAPALAAKHQIAHKLMQQNPAFFAIGVGQSLDNPREAALVIYVDREHIPAQLPSTMNGVRTRYVFMDRLHVTRSYAAGFPTPHHCMPHPASGSPDRRRPVHTPRSRFPITPWPIPLSPSRSHTLLARKKGTVSLAPSRSASYAQISTRGALPRTQSEVIHRTNGESIGIQIVRPEDLVPELVVVLGSRREAIPESHIHATARLKDGPRVVSVGRPRTWKVDAADSHQILPKWTNPSLPPKLVDRPAQRCVHPMARQIGRRCVVHIATFKFNSQPVQTRRHERKPPVYPHRNPDLARILTPQSSEKSDTPTPTVNGSFPSSAE